ncbi:hypothetical protein G6F51_014223 [Rhizopus arrhizus]|uniref:Uncharacterized protein n=1 Tax=Rhizopus oryzae TaxID=64495 RepID=A0A9P6XN99_RHIOR|nr:hypothetical protein G6F51_014223 [Rhizopus arrhizus]
MSGETLPYAGPWAGVFPAPAPVPSVGMPPRQTGRPDHQLVRAGIAAATAGAVEPGAACAKPVHLPARHPLCDQRAGSRPGRVGTALRRSTGARPFRRSAAAGG